MRSVYAIQFEIAPKPGQSADSCYEEIKQRLAGWVQNKYQKAFRSELAFTFDGTEHRPIDQHEIIGSCATIDDGRLCTLEWTHPGDTDSTLLWCIESYVAAKTGRLELSLRIRVSSLKPIVKPLDFVLGRPRIISDIIKDYPCSIGGQTIPCTPGPVGIGGVTEFVNNLLRNPERVLPLIVLSPDPHTDRPIINPYELQDELIGLASVFVMESKWVAFAFTEAVSRDYTCFNGAVRLFWPGFEFGANPWDHPLYLPDRIRRMEYDGQPLGRYFFSMLSSIASFRFREGAVIREVTDRIEAEALAETEKLREQLRSGVSDHDAMIKELERTWDRLGSLEKERALLKRRVSELEEEVEATKENLASMWEYNTQRDAQAKEASVQEEATTEIESVSGAIQAAERDFVDILEVWDSARKSADNSYYRRPVDIYRALMAIAELGRKLRDLKESKRQVGPWEEHFKHAGLKYAHTESQTTLTMYGDERRFTHRGVTIQMLKHLTVGGGSSIDCVQIYFEHDKQTGRMAIGYCGPHLSYSKQRG